MGRQNRLQIPMTETQLAAVRAAAEQVGQTVSRYGAESVLRRVLDGHRGKDETAHEVREFRSVFFRTMELSLTGKLTSARLKDLERGKTD